MTKPFYTNISISGKGILIRGVNSSGQRIKSKQVYNPTLYVPTNQKTPFKTLNGDPVGALNPGDIKETRDFIEQYRGVQNFKIYGNTQYEYAFIAEKFPGDIEWDRDKIEVAIIDIEVASEFGFPDIQNANEEITAITFKQGDLFYVFGCGPYVKSSQRVVYIKCDNEHDLITKFLDTWASNYPDILSGWYIKFFDIPYLVNRITKLFGPDKIKKLSPWGKIGTRDIHFMNKTQTTYSIQGVAILDYQELFKKFDPQGQSQESYKLNDVAQAIIGEGKLAYNEYNNIHHLYKENYQKFIDYNIRDVELIEKMDAKLKLFDLALTLAYDSKVNYEDVFMQTRMWDSLIYNHLLAKNIVIPQKKEFEKSSTYEGAYVKNPIIGLHKWVASLDLASLYPHLIMQYNLSPETLLDEKDWPDDIKDIKNINVNSILEKNVDLSRLKQNSLTITPNHQFFKIDKQGFLPELMEKMYKDRSKYKKLMLKAKQELEECNDPVQRKDIERLVSRYDNLQLAKKVSL